MRENRGCPKINPVIVPYSSLPAIAPTTRTNGTSLNKPLGALDSKVLVSFILQGGLMKQN